jgi:hypothetical protein
LSGINGSCESPGSFYSSPRTRREIELKKLDYSQTINPGIAGKDDWGEKPIQL